MTELCLVIVSIGLSENIENPSMVEALMRSPMPWRLFVHTFIHKFNVMRFTEKSKFYCAYMVHRTYTIELWRKPLYYCSFRIFSHCLELMWIKNIFVSVIWCVILHGWKNTQLIQFSCRCWQFIPLKCKYIYVGFVSKRRCWRWRWLVDTHLQTCEFHWKYDTFAH